MIPLAIMAAAAESALGSGEQAYAVPPVGEPAIPAIRRDPALAAAGMRRPHVARALLPESPERDRASVLLERVTRSLTEQLDRLDPSWRAKRLGLVIGTSSGGMISLTEALRLRSEGKAIPRALAVQAPYFGPFSAAAALLPRPRECAHVLSACASSAMAVGIACRWLSAGLVDIAIAGGYDAVGLLVASGFEAIGATSDGLPAPFREGRDGMALGEGAALVALSSRCERPLGFVRGFGASADAVHVTAPDREGRGLARAAWAALGDAAIGPERIDLISAHATATPYNDAAEARAIRATFGDAAESVVVHPFKAVIGHTLGASALLEMLAALWACRRGILPAAAGQGPVDPEARVRLLPESEEACPRTVLDLSAAFGGANAAVVLGLEPGEGQPRGAHPVEVASIGERVAAMDAEHVARLGRVDVRRLARMDPASELAVTAVASALSKLGEPLSSRTAVVVGTATGSVENDAAFAKRLLERGPRGVEPRRFPATSPNLPAGQVGIVFGLGGPALSTGTGPKAPLEALRLGHDLVRSGDAEAAVVLSLEHVGPAVEALWEASGTPVPLHGALAVVLRRGAGPELKRSALQRDPGEPRDLAAALASAARQVTR